MNSGRLVIMLVITACGRAAQRAAPAIPAPTQPPAQPTPAKDPALRAPTNLIKTDATGRRYAEADVRFMQGMIAHHGQALDMAALLPGRTNRDDMRLMAQRIDVSQRDEIAMMQRWLRSRGENAPPPGEHQHDAGAHEMLMPGMLTAAEMTQLAQATGTTFDRLFLTLMIRHHQGALRMVADLFGSQGAGQDVDIFRFASDVDTDQTAEIDRMRSMLAALPAVPQ